MYKSWWEEISYLHENYPVNPNFMRVISKRAKTGNSGFMSVYTELWMYKFLVDAGMNVVIGDEHPEISRNDFIVDQDGKGCEIEAVNSMGIPNHPKKVTRTINQKFRAKHVEGVPLVIVHNLVNRRADVDEIAGNMENVWYFRNGNPMRVDLRGVLILDRLSPVNPNPEMMMYWHPSVDNTDMPDGLLRIPETKVRLT